MLISIKVFLAIFFFPIETHSELTRLRRLLSPFMKLIQKCYLNKTVFLKNRMRICQEIIFNASSDVDPNLVTELNRLTNLTSSELASEHQLQRQFNRR